MYSVLELSDWIIKHIFRYLIRVPIPDIDTWKRYIPFLTVCHRWRYAIIHSVYRQAFINCFYYDNTGSENHILKTNIDLIVSCGWQSYVGSLSIIFRDSSDFCEILNFLIERYISQAVGWPALCDMFIAYEPNFMINIPDYNHEHSSDDIKKSLLLGNQFVEHVKNVQVLNIINNTTKYVLKHFISTLIGAYGRNLRYLKCSGIRIPKTLLYFSSQLTYLKISFYRSSTLFLPTIFSRSLEKLVLLELPSDFIMTSFADYNKIRNIYFTRLNSLTLEYQKEADNNHSKAKNTKRHYSYTISAPNLKIFHLKHAPRDFDVLHIFKELNLSSFYFDGAIQCIQNLAIEAIKVYTNMFIHITDSGYCCEESFYSITNHHFSRNVEGRMLTLSINCPNYNICPQLINWLYLQTLTVTTSLYVVTLLLMLKKIPSITKIYIFDLRSHSNGDTLENILLTLDMDNSPICLHASYIYIGRLAAYNSVTHSQMIDTVTFLLMTMPSLKNVTILREFYDDVKYIVVLNNSYYSHLNGIHIHVIKPE